MKYSWKVTIYKLCHLKWSYILVKTFKLMISLFLNKCSTIQLEIWYHTHTPYINSSNFYQFHLIWFTSFEYTYLFLYIKMYKMIKMIKLFCKWGSHTSSKLIFYSNSKVLTIVYFREFLHILKSKDYLPFINYSDTDLNWDSIYRLHKFSSIIYISLVLDWWEQNLLK